MGWLAYLLNRQISHLVFISLSWNLWYLIQYVSAHTHCLTNPSICYWRSSLPVLSKCFQIFPLVFSVISLFFLQLSLPLNCLQFSKQLEVELGPTFLSSTTLVLLPNTPYFRCTRISWKLPNFVKIQLFFLQSRPYCQDETIYVFAFLSCPKGCSHL